MSDEELIDLTLKLSKRGRGKVSPNPMVGAIVVRGQSILAKGYHRIFGGPHAEVVALNSMNSQARGASLYVNLEPCSHHGKQPPCVDQILASGIAEVVVGTKDPNPIVNGKGLRLLKRKGVRVRVGVREEACRRLNRAYFKFMESGLPYTTIKIAQTLDGRIAASDGGSKWISSEESRKHAHKLRSEHDAILVGIGTVMADNPRLNVRLAKGRNPRRVVLDSHLRIPLHTNLLSDGEAGNTIVVTTFGVPQEKVSRIEGTGATVLRVRTNAAGKISMGALWAKLGKMGIASILVEGGSQVFSDLLRLKLADQLFVFVAPKILGAGLSAIDNVGVKSLKDSISFEHFESRRIGSDVLFSGLISNPS